MCDQFNVSDRAVRCDVHLDLRRALITTHLSGPRVSLLRRDQPGNATLPICGLSIGGRCNHQSACNKGKHSSSCFLEHDIPRLLFELLPRSEEHTSELQSLMRISYAVFCLKKKKKHQKYTNNTDI